jgi:hypothetical protein
MYISIGFALIGVFITTTWFTIAVYALPQIEEVVNHLVATNTYNNLCITYTNIYIYIYNRFCINWCECLSRAQGLL